MKKTKVYLESKLKRTYSRSNCNILELKKVNETNILRAYYLFIAVEKITYLRGKSIPQKKTVTNTHYSILEHCMLRLELLIFRNFKG